MKIPLYRPYVSSAEKEGVLRVFKSRKFARGTEVLAFEREFAEYVGKKYAISLNSGTSALQVLVRVMGWKKGDEVITTPFSYIASSNCLLLEGVVPVFVDIDPLTLNIDPKKIEEKITPKTKGILLVHILGLPADYIEIKKIAQKFNLKVIEDACESLGRPDNNFIIGKFSATTYGFHENKQLTTAGEGGMIVTDDSEIAQKCLAVRDQGRSLKKDWIRHVILGFNFRMTEIQAAFGRAQLKNLDKMLVMRENIANKYFNLLKDVSGIRLPQFMINCKRSWFFYFILLKDPKMRERVCENLSNKGISFSTNYFPPIYKFAMYKKYKNGLFPNTEYVSQSILVLPTFCEIKDKEIKLITETIKMALNY